MQGAKNPITLVSGIGRNAPALGGWLRHHHALGVRRVVIYGKPKGAVTDLAGEMKVICRPLRIDAGPLLKSAMLSAMAEGLVAEGGWAMALGPDEYLDPGTPTLDAALAALPEACAAWVLTQAGGQTRRTLFRTGHFAGHDGTRPLLPSPGAAPLWCDAQGAVIDPDHSFWSPAAAPLPDTPARVIAADAPPALSAASPAPAERPDWHAEIGTGGSTGGFFKRLDHQSLVHIDRPSDRLVVTFDNLSAVNDTAPDRAPWGYKCLREAGCAHLGVLAHRKDWYRAPDLIAALQALRDEGLFARYREVIFTGTSMGGFAAMAFSSLAPGARVLAFSPQSTLDEAVVPWETRFGMGRMRNWRLPHSDSAFEIESAREVIVISDPYFALDQRHVERLRTPNVLHLKAWFSGHFSPVFLRRAKLLKPVMGKMLDGALTQEAFYSLYRGRRALPWYRRSLQEALTRRGHTALAAQVGPAFRRLHDRSRG